MTGVGRTGNGLTGTRKRRDKTAEPNGNADTRSAIPKSNDEKSKKRKVILRIAERKSRNRR